MYVTLLYLSLITIIYTKCLLSKDTNISTKFQGKRKLMTSETYDQFPR
jgi:hypothetical protein